MNIRAKHKVLSLDKNLLFIKLRTFKSKIFRTKIVDCASQAKQPFAARGQAKVFQRTKVFVFIFLSTIQIQI